jgi:NAD(P)-dependent dehydrogenase (short-subunit alcohol dehydrogenase family)
MVGTQVAGSFAGKVAFVTGGGSGIGRAAAIAFAQADASVAIIGLSESQLQETARRGVSLL